MIRPNPEHSNGKTRRARRNDRVDSPKSRISERRLSFITDLEDAITPSPGSVDEAIDTLIRLISPKLCIGIGGEGCKINSLTKKKTESLDFPGFVDFLNFDTDPASKRGDANGVAFADDEFVEMSTERNRLAAEDINAHPHLAKRMGLDNPEQATRQLLVANQGTTQAGQDRQNGSLTFAANREVVRSAVRSKIAKLQGVHSRLEREMDHRNGGRVQVQNRLTIFLIGSITGGTGSPNHVELSSMIREETREMGVNLVAILPSVSCFDELIPGSEQASRMYCNGAMTIREIEAAQNGALHDKGVTFGLTKETATPIPPGLFSQIYLPTRHLSDGRSMESGKDVREAASMFLMSMTATEIGDEAMTDDDNLATMQALMKPDPVTKRHRHVSTFASAAIALPIDELVDSMSTTWLTEFVRKCVTDSSDGVNWEQAADAWLTNPLPGKPISLRPHELSEKLKSLTLPSERELTRSLFVKTNGSQHQHFRNARFCSQAEAAKTAFAQKVLPGVASRLADTSAKLIDDMKSSLLACVRKEVAQSSWADAELLIVAIADRLSAGASALDDEARLEHERSVASLEVTKQHIGRLSQRLRGWGCDKKRQRAVADQLMTSFSAAVRAKAKTSAADVLRQLLYAANRERTTAERVIASATHRIESTVARSQVSRGARSVTTNSSAEINVMTDRTMQRLFSLHRPIHGEIMKRLVPALGKSIASATRRLVSKDKAFDAVQAAAKEWFRTKLSKLSVVDVLAAQLRDLEERPVAQAKLRHLLGVIQPMWQAEPGRLGLQFPDATIIGIPRGSDDDEGHQRSIVAKALKAVTESHVGTDARYNGTVTQTTVSDRHRIIATRRVHGASWHWIRDVRKCMTELTRWEAEGGNWLSVFSRETMASMPSIMPSDKTDTGKLAFALGLCFGAIAQRGGHYYRNLDVVDREKEMLRCRLASHWDGLAFSGGKRIELDGVLSTIVDSGRLSFDEQNIARAEDKIAQGMDGALEAICKDREFAERVLTLFGDLCAAAGNVKVSAELDDYLAALSKRNHSSGENYLLIREMIELLGQEVARLRQT
ncbi:tubulin-like doman-containing protein [Aporhodopirellula aestuarii]|uniref:Tubulin-like doman-containing protein n=1 Tax=Aporhodopirellula aestuarii TaxID=2950107 RepID=A0ABT0UCF2_9BACT|nr:tubulin-like doman-containing protein [Aporhodopirellula aestuarii]MCM2374568.1 tubulin-like doman-containing protein [Aporhodopirellula aestuarii]